MTAKSLKNIGILIPVGIALLAFLVDYFFGLSLILGSLIAGIVLGNLVSLNDKFDAGIKTASGFILELAIVFMAFSINYSRLLDLGLEIIAILVATVTFVLVMTLFLAKRLRCPGSVGWLVGFGTAICGSSAIASLAPLVSKDKNDVGLSLAVVNILGLAGMIAIPYLGQFWLNDVDLATLIGASLHSAGNVAGAGFVINEEVGNIAVAVKMGRIALLTPALLAFQWALGKQHKGSDKKGKLSLPWYLVAFIVVSILVSVIPFHQVVLSGAKEAANALLAIAMAAIGLRMNLTQLAKTGRKGLLFGVLIFALQLVFISVLLVLF